MHLNLIDPDSSTGIRRPIILILTLTATACILAACGGDKDKPTSTLSKTERDSVLSDSDLPGAAGVKGALAVSDSAQARADRANAASVK